MSQCMNKCSFMIFLEEITISLHLRIIFKSLTYFFFPVFPLQPYKALYKSLSLCFLNYPLSIVKYRSSLFYEGTSEKLLYHFKCIFQALKPIWKLKPRTPEKWTGWLDPLNTSYTFARTIIHLLLS